MERKQWWNASNALSLLFLILIGGMWVYTTHKYNPNSLQLTDKEDVENHLSTHFSDLPVEQVPTGVFIQSLKFNNSTEVNFTGYVWQTFDISYTSQYEKPEDVPVGFILPEAVESGDNIEPKFSYSKKRGNKETIGWYFEATLKQKFDYSKYPFDHKIAWIRMWSNDLNQGKLLVPDFGGYESTGVHDKFGYDQDIVLGHWDLLETFFDYQSKNYNTNLGIFENKSLKSHPELYFNIVIKRRFINSFVVYILPLAIIACLTFATLMMITNDPEKESKLGMNTSGVIGVCSGLFFVVLLSQVQIREQFAGTSIVYIEYFYPLMYMALLGVSVNSYLFSNPNDGNNWILNWVHHGDNINPKLLFWPLLLGSATVITACVLLPERNDKDRSTVEPVQSFLLEEHDAPHLDIPLVWDSAQSESLDYTFLTHSDSKL